SVMKCIAASRQLVDMYFLPRHLALAANIEEHKNKFHRADEYYDEAEQLIGSMLLNVPSAAVKASLIATMDAVFRGHFELAAKKNQIRMAFRILENVRGRIISDNLRARPQAPISANANPAIKVLNRIQGRLLRTTDVAARARLVDQLEHIEERNDLTALS